MQSYIFGGNTGIATPEELEERRRWARAMVQSGMQGGSKNVSEGLGNIARALSGNYASVRADEEQAKGIASAGSAYRPIAEAVVNKSTPSGEDLNAALANPWMSDGQKLIIRQFVKNQYGDSSDTDDEYGLKPVWGKDANGNVVLFQPPRSGGVRL